MLLNLHGSLLLRVDKAIVVFKVLYILARHSPPAECVMDSTKVQRIGGPRSRSTSCAPTFIEEARLMNRQVRLARTRSKLRKFSDFSPLEETSDKFDYSKERVSLISNSSDDLQSNCEHGSSSKSCSNLISVHSSRFGGSVEVLYSVLYYN